MRLRPRARKAWLTAHIVISVGWLGGAYAMLVLSIAAMTDPAVYGLMHRCDTAVMIPGSAGALATGLVLGLGTPWRVLRHWWVVVKLLLTVGAMAFAYVYLARPVQAAQATNTPDPYVIAGSAVMVAVLFTTTALSVVKPWGRTRR